MKQVEYYLYNDTRFQKNQAKPWLDIHEPQLLNLVDMSTKTYLMPPWLKLKGILRRF